MACCCFVVFFNTYLKHSVDILLLLFLCIDASTIISAYPYDLFIYLCIYVYTNLYIFTHVCAYKSACNLYGSHEKAPQQSTDSRTQRTMFSGLLWRRARECAHFTIGCRYKLFIFRWCKWARHMPANHTDCQAWRQSAQPPQLRLWLQHFECEFSSMFGDGSAITIAVGWSLVTCGWMGGARRLPNATNGGWCCRQSLCKLLLKLKVLFCWAVRMRIACCVRSTMLMVAVMRPKYDTQKSIMYI